MRLLSSLGQMKDEDEESKVKFQLYDIASSTSNETAVYGSWCLIKATGEGSTWIRRGRHGRHRILPVILDRFRNFVEMVPTLPAIHVS